MDAADVVRRGGVDPGRAEVGEAGSGGSGVEAEAGTSGRAVGVEVSGVDLSGREVKAAGGDLGGHRVVTDRGVNSSGRETKVAAGGDLGEHGVRWGIGLVTEGFDVVDLPAEYGALLNHQLKASCPTAMAPLHRRWWFFLVPGSISAAQVAAAGGVLHAGADDWVPAPGTRLETAGRIRWLVHPYLTGWRPYERRDAIDQVFR